MKANGWQGDAISVFEHNGSKYILDGHHRVVAARAAGIEVPYNSIPASRLLEFNYKSVDDVILSAVEAGGR
jgi:ParB-like chromosome segregation protein Spo0J